MMLPQDALVLALTKLKTRRIRLAVTVVISGLLFILLTLASLVVNGALQSVDSFTKEGFGSRYLLQVYPAYSDYYLDLAKPEVVATAKSQLEDLKLQKKAEAKRLNIDYDPASEQAVIIPNGSPTGTDIVDSNTKIGSKLMAESIAKNGETTAKETQTVLSQYPIREVYKSLMFASPYGMFGVQNENSYSLIPIKNGKESDASINSSTGLPSKGIDTLANGMTVMSNALLEPFILEGQSAEVINNQIAVLAPYDAAEEILGLTPLSINASTKQKLDRIKEVREKISGTTFDVCLRNKASINNRDQAKQTAADIEQNKNIKGYVLPDLIYSVQESPCTDVVITRDKRNKETKEYTAKQDEFDQKFGKALPAQRIATFRVIGITSSQPDYQGFKITDLLGSVLTSSIGSGWFIPESQLEALPEFANDVKAYLNGTDQNMTTYVEFSRAEDARTFVKERTCEPNYTFEVNNDPMAECRAHGKLTIASFGSNSLAMDEFRKSFSSIFSKALLVISLISAVILMGTVGKIINDSRRETAVFRAIGAKRFDIAQIYLTYTFLISLVISLFAVSVAYFIASFIDRKFASDFTLQALVSFNAKDLTKTFSLVGIDIKQVLTVVGIIIIGSLVSALVPLLTNLRRNPIKDMRDER